MGDGVRVKEFLKITKQVMSGVLPSTHALDERLRIERSVLGDDAEKLNDRDIDLLLFSVDRHHELVTPSNIMIPSDGKGGYSEATISVRRRNTEEILITLKSIRQNIRVQQGLDQQQSTPMRPILKNYILALMNTIVEVCPGPVADIHVFPNRQYIYVSIPDPNHRINEQVIRSEFVKRCNNMNAELSGNNYRSGYTVSIRPLDTNRSMHFFKEDSERDILPQDSDISPAPAIQRQSKRLLLDHVNIFKPIKE